MTSTTTGTATGAAEATPLGAAVPFFAPISLWQDLPTPALRAALADAPRVAPQPGSVFTTGDSGLISCILAEQKVGPELQKQLDTQKQNLIDLCGVGSAYVRKQADVTKNPNLVYDTQIWEQVFNHLPLMGPSSFSRQTYDESMHGVEMATSFIQMIMGFAVGGGPALTGFTNFLQGLGQSIRAGVTRTRKTFSTAAITIVLQTQVVGSETHLVPMLKGYFIDFSESQSKVYSSCASYESFHMQFDYRVAQSVFNFRALEDPKIGPAFSSFIKGTQADDVTNASNFFNGAFAPAAKTGT